MNSERWKQIDEIFHSALNLDPSARMQYLSEACKEDPALLREIEKLLASHEKELSRFDRGAEDPAAEFLTKQGWSHQGSIAHYKVVKKIGRGGMGDVYLAEDTRLNRKVALKLLPSEFTNDKERVRRFEREARVVSALNHPNILTIYDIGQIDSGSFIASEFIDGETLRECLQKSKLQLKAILTIGIQVAEALDAAHRAGVIHRDIKPENIMLRKDGYVKVLDFGLAKLSGKETKDDLSHLETISKTQAGLIVGTLRYMSPEQARGFNVDARSDIFSLGTVLYELITGRPPFDGPTSQDILVAILEKRPPQLQTYGEFPEELQWMIAKAQAKDPDERYQTTKEFLTDLKRIKKRLDIDEELKHSGSTTVHTVRSQKKIALLLPILLISIAVTTLLFVRSAKNNSERKIPFNKIKLAPLTTSGVAWNGIISPDGKYVAYVQENTDRAPSLYLKHLASDTEKEILRTPEGTSFYEDLGFRFSPDGNYIYYLTWSLDKNITSLHKIPVFGGLSNKLLERLDFIPGISPLQMN